MAVNLGFFGLTREPFNPSPDPAFLFLSPGHDEALAQLLYGVNERKAFMLLTGEVGTGKTTLLRSLLARLGSDTAASLVTHSALPFEGIIECILNGFGIAKGGQSLTQQILALQNFLMDRHHAGLNTVIILDEAQNLSRDTLEQVRLLSNFETATDKLLQIVLTGQPELAATLAAPDLRQLDQRIALRCRTIPLTRSEVREYIDTRLRIAGAMAPGIFTDEAVDRIARASRGIPRLINNICDHCLISAYADQVRRVDRKIADDAIRYFERPPVRGRRARPGAPRRTLAWLSGAAAAASLLAVLGRYSAQVMDWARSMRDLVSR